MSQPVGYSDLAQALNIIVNYLRDKYQIPNPTAYILLTLALRAFEEKWGYRPLDLGVFERLIHAPALAEPLWLKALRELTKINTTTNIVTEVHGKRLLERFR